LLLCLALFLWGEGVSRQAALCAAERSCSALCLFCWGKGHASALPTSAMAQHFGINSQNKHGRLQCPLTLHYDRDFVHPQPSTPSPTGNGLNSAPTKGAHRTAHVYAAGCASRSRRDEHALCRPRDAAAPPAGSGGGRAVRLLSASIDTLCLILTPHPPGGQLSHDDHGLAWLASTLEHVLCMQPVSPPCQQCPANSAAACSDCAFCRRIPVILAPRLITGRPPRARPAHWAAAAAGRRRAGRSIPILERTVSFFP
jgi:hypothetical protein